MADLIGGSARAVQRLEACGNFLKRECSVTYLTFDDPLLHFNSNTTCLNQF
jgi:hypothetical protein